MSTQSGRTSANGHPPDDDAVRAQLERILVSEGFANAERLRRFLRFIVEGALEGRGDGLKEYAVGVEVFDRDASYDPRIDSIVRVEARRLRSKLAEYYASGGGANELVIGLRKGSYVPYFEPRSPQPIAEQVDGQLDASNKRRPPTGIRKTLIAAAVLMIAGVLVWTAWPPAASSRVAASVDTLSVAVLPFEHYSTADADRLLAGRVTDGLTAALAGVESLTVRSRTSAQQFSGGRPGIATVATTLNVRFVVEGSVLATGSGVRVDARLVDAALDRKVWTNQLTTAEPQLDAAIQQMASAIADELIRRAGRAAATPR